LLRELDRLGRDLRHLVTGEAIMLDEAGRTSI
jgi:hypothetical protein